MAGLSLCSKLTTLGQLTLNNKKNQILLFKEKNVKVTSTLYV